MKKHYPFLLTFFLLAALLWWRSFFHWVFFGVCNSCGPFYAIEYSTNELFDISFWPQHILIAIFSLIITKGSRT